MNNDLISRKYELTNEKKEFLGRTLYRIRALKDFELLDGTIIHAGDLGGWIEKEDNLSQEGSAWVSGNAQVSGNARVYRIEHIMTFGPAGSRNGTTTFYRNKNNGISVTCGCFNGSIEGFLARVNETHGDNKHGQVYRAAAELAKLQIDLEDVE
ncbi:MAG: hypothetical protein ACLVG9_02315 [Eubacteriales bacterium]